MNTPLKLNLATLILMMVLLAAFSPFFWRRTISRAFPEHSSANTLPLSLDDGNISRGNLFIYGLAPSISLQEVANVNVSWAMPASSIFDALIYDHLPAWAMAAIQGTLIAAFLALIFYIGLEINSLWCGLAAIFYLHSSILTFYTTGDKGLFTLLFLLAAALFVGQDKQNDWDVRNSSLVGIVLGLSLLQRSELFLLPPVLAFYLFYAKQTPSKKLLPLLTLPYLILIPWIYMNYQIYHHLIIFEHHRADNDIVASALGLVQTMEGDYYKLAGLHHGTSLIPWAIKEVAIHPLRFLAAYIKRLLFFTKLFPVASAFAAFGVWHLREREAVKRLSVVIVYYIAIHCLMPVETGYFDPIYPLVILMALASIFSLIKDRNAAIFPTFNAWNTRLRQALRAAMFGILGIFTAFGVFTLSLISLYPSRSRHPAPLNQIIANHPHDAWLWWWEGRKRLFNHAYTNALDDFSHALKLRSSRTIQLDYAWALTASNHDPRMVISNFNFKRLSFQKNANILEMLFYLEQGNINKAASQWRSAWEAWIQSDSRDRGNSTQSLKTTSELRKTDTRILFTVRDFLIAWPKKSRQALIAKIVETFHRPQSFANPKIRDLYIKTAPHALLYDPYQPLYLAQNSGHYHQALSISDQLLARYPNSAKVWGDRGVLDYLMGHKNQAIADSLHAIKIDKAYLPSYLTLGSLYLAKNRPDKTLALYRLALKRPPPHRYQKLWKQMAQYEKQLTRNYGFQKTRERRGQ